MLSVYHLRKQFSTILAVDDVSFSVRPGQIFGLIGPNGAGKTTTIRMIMDIIQPDAGSVIIDGAPMSDAGKNLVGYLPEERGLYRKNKVINVIRYFASLKGLSPRDAVHAARPLLERFNLTKYERRNVEELSKGNQQKLQFIISVLHNPRLLVLDELFSGLDPVNQVLMRDALMDLKRDNRAIIFSTHHMEQAEKLCDELLMINNGRTVLHGSPAEIKSRHGKNAVQVQFTGDAEFLRELPTVRRADIAQNFAELELDAGTDTNALISAMLPHLAISSVSRVEPSLQSIFIDIVGLPAPDASEDAEENESAKHGTVPSPLKDKKNKAFFFRGLLLLAMGVFFLLRFIQEGAIMPMLAAVTMLAGGIGFLVAFARRRSLLRREALNTTKEVER